jgi:hypothetical protein
MGGVARIGVEPAKHHAEGTINLFMPESAIATVLTKEKIERPQAEVGRIRFERLDAMKHWRLRCKDIALVFPNATPMGLPKQGERTGAAGQVDLEPAFDAWMPGRGTVARDKTVDEMNFVQIVSSGSFEQAGRYSGRVRLGNRQATIDGVGVRERSWGPWDPSRHASRWLAAAFGPALSFGVRATSGDDGDRTSGWVCREGEVRAVRSVRLETEMEGRIVRRARLAITDEAGDEIEASAETVSTVPMREGSARVQQSMMRFACGARETLGLGEFLDDLRP